MPELPEVETVRRGLAGAMEGKRFARIVARRADLRRPLPPDLAARLTGQIVNVLGRRAKYLTVEVSSGDVLLIHLGMSGRMRIEPGSDGNNGMTVPALTNASAADAHDRHEHVVFVMEDGTTIRYSDPRRFGSMDLCSAAALSTHKLLAHLGPEPLDAAFDGAALADRLKGKNTPIKTALLDQRIVAGLGNIYVCESLYMAGISPRRKAANVSRARIEKLVPAIKDVLTAAIAAGGSSLKDHQTPDGELGYFQHSFKVYGREGEKCATDGCSGMIKRLVQAGRSTFYCSACQR